MMRSLWILIPLFFTSCQPKPVVKAGIETDGFWSYDDVLVLEYEESDTASVYDLVLAVDHTREYAFENLYIKIHNLFPNGDTLSSALSLDLADKKGRWFGDCGRHQCHAIIDLQKDFFFPQKGGYKIWIEQYMREAQLEGVTALELALYKAKRDKD